MAEHFVESVEVAAVSAHAAAWRDLCGRALEANAFAEPAFLIAAARHIAPPGVEFILVWADERRQKLVGLLAISSLRLGVAEIWQSEQAGLAAIALDREAAAETFDSVAQWLRDKRRAAALLAPTLASDGKTARLLAEFVHRLGSTFVSLHPRQRAILSAARDERARFEAALNGKRLKEWRRLRRRLAERGVLAFRAAECPAALAATSEAFLALEPKSWKGRGGAPLVADPARAAFAREMLKSFASENKLRVCALELADAPIAMGVVLSSQGRAFYWKTAYDEAFAEFSPGVLLTLDLSRVQEADPKVEATDSCAIEDHPMIDRLWPGRLALEDRLVPLGSGADWRVKLWLAKREQTRLLKEIAKRALFPLLGRKRS